MGFGEACEKGVRGDKMRQKIWKRRAKREKNKHH